MSSNQQSETEAENGDVGLDRTPVPMPSRDGRVTTVPFRDLRLIVGYTWAVYAVIDDGTLYTFKGWKNFSDDTDASLVGLEAAAAETLSGAPAIELKTDHEQSGAEIEPPTEILVRTDNSEASRVFPDEVLVQADGLE